MLQSAVTYVMEPVSWCGANWGALSVPPTIGALSGPRCTIGAPFGSPMVCPPTDPPHHVLTYDSMICSMPSYANKVLMDDTRTV